MAVNLDKIRTAAQRVASSHGLDVVDVEYQTVEKQKVVRVFIEKNADERARLIAQAESVAGNPMSSDVEVAEGGLKLNTEQIAGVTHDDCQVFSRDFGTILDVEELVPVDEYTLEVSSPGLDRKLYTADDYRRFSGSLVKLQTFEPVAGNRHWQGRLTLVGDRTIVLNLSALKQKGKSKKVTQESVEFDLANIEKANLIPEI
jgi:ribosome maturation factor RimP